MDEVDLGSPNLNFRERLNHFNSSDFVVDDLNENQLRIFKSHFTELHEQAAARGGLPNIQEGSSKALAKVNKALAKFEIDINLLLKDSDFKKIYTDLLEGTTLRNFVKELFLEEEALISFYTTNAGYYNFNKALRGELPITDFYTNYEKVLNKALSKLPKHKKTTYRGLGKEGSDYFSKLKEGDIFTEKEFTSSTLDEELAENFMYMKKGNTVLIIEGETGVAIHKISQAEFEEEILFQSNRTFKIVKKTYKARIVEDDPIIQNIHIKEIK